MTVARWVLPMVLTAVVAACSGPADAPSAPARPPSPPMTEAVPTDEPTAAPTDEPTAAASALDPRVGAVFLGGQGLHVCSGSVLDAGAEDLILTAAHCVADGVDAYFVPGLTGRPEPDDFWRVDAVYLDPRWRNDQDPLADFAIARVSRDDGQSLKARAGGGFRLGPAPPPGTDVTVRGYAFGVDGDQLGCRAHTTTHGDYPELPCAGLVDGTSGSPWVSGTDVVGIVGGLEGGGCAENVSYSPPFGVAVRQVLDRATAGGAGDVAPSVYDDDC